MNDRVAQAAARLDAVAVPLGLRRLETMGEHESGAYGFYATRLRRGTIFSDYDLALARALLDWPGAPRAAHEIGGGYGSLCFLLAMLGFRTTCLEVDPRRFAAAAALKEGMGAAFEEIRGRCRVMNQRFPTSSRMLPAGGALALITNLVFTTTAQQKAEILQALRAYPFAIVDVDRFLTFAATPEEQATRVTEFAAAGLVGEPFLDVGRSARFWRFHAG
jgi:hypothetical protein